MVRKAGRANLSSMLESVNEPVVQPVKESRVKRCYMLTDSQLQRLIMLKAKLYRDKDLSDIIGMAIDSYYELQVEED
jgi:hypothetical protein